MTSSTQPEKKTKSKIGTILLILAICLSTAFWVFVLYSDYELVQGSYDVNVADYPTVTQIDILYNADFIGADINIREGNPDKIFNASWEHLYNSWGDSNINPINITITHELINNNTLQISITTTAEENDLDVAFGVNSFEFWIDINPSYMINFTADGSLGSINIDGENANFGKISIIQSTGSIDLDLENSVIRNELNLVASTGSAEISLQNVELDTDLSVSHSTGSIDLNLWNITSSTNRNINITASTGSIEVYWEQPNMLSYDMNFNLVANTGSIDMILDLPNNSTGYDIQMSTSLGSQDLDSDLEFDEIYHNEDQSRYQSANFAVAGDIVAVDANASTGSIEILIKD